MRYKAAIEVPEISDRSIQTVIQDIRENKMVVIGYEPVNPENRPRLTIASRERPRLEQYIMQYYRGQPPEPVDNLISATES